MTWDDALRSIWERFAVSPVWGSSDCCMFAAAYVKAITGIDHSAAFEYHDKTSALRIIAEHDGDIANIITKCLGPAHTEAQPGDLVVCNAGEIRTTGVFNGYCVCGVHPEYGLARVLPFEITHAWSLTCPK